MIDCGGNYEVGDPRPVGYLQCQDWADVHLKAGLKQERCCQCGKWYFPHELSDKRIKTPCIIETRANRRKYFEKGEMVSRICHGCIGEAVEKVL